MDEDVMMGAAWSGNLELVRWLRAEGCPWDEGTCHNAVANGRRETAAEEGHAGTLRWLRENNCPWSAESRDQAAQKFGYTDDFRYTDDESDDEYGYEYYSDDE